MKLRIIIAAAVLVSYIAVQARTLTGTVGEFNVTTPDTIVLKGCDIATDDFILTEQLAGQRTSLKPFGPALRFVDGRLLKVALSPVGSCDFITGYRNWRIKLLEDGQILSDTIVKGDLAGDDGKCAVTLQRNDGQLTLSTRHHNHIQLGCVPESVEGVGAWCTPGETLKCEQLCVTVERSSENASDQCQAMTPDAIAARLERSYDPLEGFWFLCGYSEDSDYLRRGGDYRLAIVRQEHNPNYTLYYMDGARVLPDKWDPGMVKGQLISMGAPGIFRVEWICADGTMMKADVYGEIESAGTLKITFPRHNSTLTFRRDS